MLHDSSWLTDALYALREALPVAGNASEWQASVVEIAVPTAKAETYEVLRECAIDTIFDGDGKGFEVRATASEHIVTTYSY
jgi:hypothetical protein